MYFKNKYPHNVLPIFYLKYNEKYNYSKKFNNVKIDNININEIY